jgi:hypothetical protein
VALSGGGRNGNDDRAALFSKSIAARDEGMAQLAPGVVAPRNSYFAVKGRRTGPSAAFDPRPDTHYCGEWGWGVG